MHLDTYTPEGPIAYLLQKHLYRYLHLVSFGLSERYSNICHKRPFRLVTNNDKRKTRRRRVRESATAAVFMAYVTAEPQAHQGTTPILHEREEIFIFKLVDAPLPYLLKQ